MGLIKVGIETETISIWFHILVIHQYSKFLHNPHTLILSFLSQFSWFWFYFSQLCSYHLFDLAYCFHELFSCDFWEYAFPKIQHYKFRIGKASFLHGLLFCVFPIHPFFCSQPNITISVWLWNCKDGRP